MEHDSNTNRFAECESLTEVVYQAIGAGSTCWEFVDRAGVFDSTEAKAIGDEAMHRLFELWLPKPSTATLPKP